MNILWITYAPLGKASQVIEGYSSQSGTWIDATAYALLREENIKLGIACIASKTVKIYDEESRITFWGLNKVRRVSGKIPSQSDIVEWKNILEDFDPDVIMVWGTEYANGLSVLEAAKEIPVLFFIQGVIGRITEYPLGLLSIIDVIREIGFIKAIKFFHYKRNMGMQKRQKYIEELIIEKANGIITDNQWSNSYYRTLMNKNKIYHLPLAVNPIFLENKFDINNIERHSIFTIDGCNPAKGVFHLIKALKNVKNKYPDVKLYIPGRVASRRPKLVFESPYFSYLKALIQKYRLEDNVRFCGQLTSEQMKERLLSCNVFVMPSCVENHSASLREAMYLGVPCITSAVGSVTEFTKYGHDVLSYRYEEEGVLADCICRIFDDKELAAKLGNNAYFSIRQEFPQEIIGKEIKKVYEMVVDNE